MAQQELNEPSSSDEVSLKDIFDEAMKLFDKTETGTDACNSDSVQLTIKRAIKNFEKATNLVSLSGMFSKNEAIEELPTETLQYLLLPALLGTLSLKLCGQPRINIINIADIYFRDFLQRCKDYGVTDVEIPKAYDPETAVVRKLTDTERITELVMSREAKIKRFKEVKELKDKLSTLSKAMESPNIDDATKRDYFTTQILNYVNQAVDELKSIEDERTIIEYMAHRVGESKPSKKERAPPLKPVIITRDAIQKAVYGAGYPSLPTMTVEEFYDKRVRDGIFPSGTNIPHATIQTTEADANEDEEVKKERLEERDDAEELARKRNMDEYKDEHRRGSGNRHNRS